MQPYFIPQPPPHIFETEPQQGRHLSTLEAQHEILPTVEHVEWPKDDGTMGAFILVPINEKGEVSKNPENEPCQPGWAMLNDYNSVRHDGIKRPQGIFVFHKDIPMPQKGFPTPAATAACDIAKRIFISQIEFLTNKNLIPAYLALLFLPRKRKIRLIERWIKAYLSIANPIIWQYRVKDSHLSECALELKTFVQAFLAELGIEQTVAEDFAKTFATLIDYDTAYRYRIEDLASETTWTQMYEDPVGEMKRLVGILGERDQREKLLEKFNSFATLFEYGAWFIKKPFRKALHTIDWSRLQLDDVDRYRVQHMADYQFFGEPYELRKEKYSSTTYQGIVFGNQGWGTVQHSPGS